MKKGRSERLIAKRDEKLLLMYHLMTNDIGCRFDYAFEYLSEEELFISEERIVTIVRENHERLDELSKQSLSKKEKKLLKYLKECFEMWKEEKKKTARV